MTRRFQGGTAQKTVQSENLNWNEYQQNIFGDVKDGENNLVVQARAGTGKTTTIIEAIRHLPRSSGKVLLCAFNKRIQLELEKRAPSHVTVKTLHAIGLRNYFRNLPFYGLRNGDGEVDSGKGRRIAGEVIEESGWFVPKTKDFYTARRMVVKLVGLAKNTLASTEDEIQQLCEAFEIDEPGFSSVRLAHVALHCMERASKETATVDFDDMLWFPWKHNYGQSQIDGPRSSMDSFDVIFVDEAQDLNSLQIWLIYRMCKADGRIICFGDDRQAIYQFRGADEYAMARLIDELDADTKPLSVCYRCPTSVLDLAREVCPDIEAAPGAPEGKVVDVDFDTVVASAKPGDFVLSRINAPLMSVCLALLAKGTPATVAGKDVGAQLKGLIEQSKARTLSGLLSWLSEWILVQYNLYFDERPSRYRHAKDRANALRVVAKDCDTLQALLNRMERLFSDDTPEGMVVCSTVHKAKGLERDRVWLLCDTFRGEGKQAEDNVWYVSVTRAKKALYLVHTPVQDFLGVDDDAD